MFWFLVAVGLLVALIVQSNKNNKVDQGSLSYRQGYWDGVRAAKQENGVAEPKASAAEASGGVSATTPAAATAAVATKVAEESLVADVKPKSAPESAPRDTNQPPAPYMASPGGVVAAPSKQPKNNHTVINVALYVAVLLLLSGIILLAQTAGIPEALRAVIVWLMVFVLYTAGLVVAKKVPIIKPAAIALVGTALAGVPVAGITMYSLMIDNAAICWLISSLIGFGLYSFATIRFQSRFLAYVSILSIFTATMSLPAVVSASLIWYYVLMIAFGAALTLASRLPSLRLPKVFAQSVSISGSIAVPAALFSTLISFMALSSAEYTVIFLSGLLYYVAQAVTLPDGSLRNYSNIMARLITFGLAISLTAWVGNDSLTAMGIALFAVAVTHVLASVLLSPRGQVKSSINEAMIWIGFAVAGFIAPFFVVLDNPAQKLSILAAMYTTLAAASIYAAVWLRRFGLLWPVLYVSLMLPPVIMEIFAVGYTPGVRLVIYAALIAVVMVLRMFMKSIKPSAAALIYTSIGIWLLTATPVLGSVLQAAVWWLLLAATLYYVAIIEKKFISLAFAHGATLAAIATTFAHFDIKMAHSVIILNAVNLLGVLAVSELAYWRNWSRLIPKTYHISGLVYASLLSLVTFLASGWELFAVWLPITALFMYVAYRRGHKVLLYITHAVITVQLITLGIALFDDQQYKTMSLVAGLTFVGFGAVSLIYRLLGQRNTLSETWWRSGIVIGMLFGVLTLPAEEVAIVILAETVLIGAAIVLGMRDFRAKRPRFIDVGAIFALIGLQRLLDIQFADVHMLVNSHLWVALLAGLALVYHFSGCPKHVTWRLVFMLIFLTMPTLSSALGEGGWYQLLFLIEHALLVVVGVVIGRKLLTIWGAVGVTLAVLYMLREFQALMNIAIALLVILAVVYAIIRATRREKAKPDTPSDSSDEPQV